MTPACAIRRGSDILLDALVQHGIPRIWGFPGAVPDFVESLSASAIDFVPARHPAAAAIMAESVTLSTNRPSACFVAGPADVLGVLVTVAIAHAGGVPLLVLLQCRDTSVPADTGLSASEAGGRLAPMLKRTIRPATAAEIPAAIDRAIGTAAHGRPGPVLVQLSRTVLQEVIPVARGRTPERAVAGPWPETRQLRWMREALTESQRPVALAGDEIAREGAEAALQAFAERFGIPVFTTFSGKGLIPEDHALSLGALSEDVPVTQEAILDASDLVLVLGGHTRSVVPVPLRVPHPGRRLIFVGAWTDHMVDRVRFDLEIVAPVGELLAQLAEGSTPPLRSWTDAAVTRERVRAAVRARSPGDARVCTVLDIVRAELGPDDILVCDAGPHAAAVGLYYQAWRPRTVLFPFALAGSIVPSAIGARAAATTTRVVALATDAELLASVQEIETSVRAGLPIVIVLVDARVQWTLDIPPASHDALGLVNALGGVAVLARSPSQLEGALRTACQAPLPTLIVAQLPADAALAPNGGLAR